ncbi:Hypothetical Protein FCC1311_071972 [Hondaea fermentalgiana]|uniref:Vms1-associating treble clef domain-containing protein n=1 Tax=Hondaea fermentalgiana TaxID=2315210 RepID=A0A2R5GJA4_9STRA|nr:Hypothetical Protein FCC1311_071972 [Hondaea fermentalgiana]|eukprot:GBG30976.1 Hypothetical Protein FCC1311_071972 [Hondaea fermentalgiana]
MLVSVLGARDVRDDETEGCLVLAPERVRWASDVVPDDAHVDSTLGSLNELAAARADPERLARNWALCETVDEAENELAAATDLTASKLGRNLLICEGSPPERHADREALVQAATRLETRGGALMVLGSGWARPSRSPASSGTSSREDRISILRDRFIADLEGTPAQSPRCGFIGEVDIEDEQDLDDVVCAAARAQKIIAQRHGNGRPPVVIRISGLARTLASLCKDGENFVGSHAAFASLLERCARMLALFEQEADSGETAPNSLVIAGLLDALPHAYLGLELLSQVLDSVSSALFVTPTAQLSIEANAAMGTHLVASTLVHLSKCGFADRLCVCSGVRFKTDLQKWGGDGYAMGPVRLAEVLARAGLPTESVTRILGENLFRTLLWYAPPVAEAPKPRPRWACDGPCGKTYSAKREPFTRLEFRYCSMDCLRAHQRELDADKPAKDDGNRRGGGGRRGAGNVGKWGVTVGSS